MPWDSVLRGLVYDVLEARNDLVEARNNLFARRRVGPVAIQPWKNLITRG